MRLRKPSPTGILAITLGGAAIAAMPAVADASHWYYNRQPILPGVVQEVPSRATEMAVTVHRHEATAINASCAINGVTALWNEPEPELGYGEVRSISFACTSEAGAVTVTPSGAWTSVLTGTELPLTDTFTGVELGVTIAGIDYGTFAGSLSARMGDKDPVGAKDNVEGRGDDLDAFLFFYNARLRGANLSSLTLTGYYKLSPGKREGAMGELK